MKHVSINEGEIVALVGESGSGKSVTAQSIIGLNQELIHIDDGNVSFQSKELTNLQESEWNQIRGKDISFIFQDAFIFKPNDEGRQTNYRSNFATWEKVEKESKGNCD